MQAFFATLTAAAIALHAIVGCCAHHAHAGDSEHHEPANIGCHERPSSEMFTAVHFSPCTEESHSEHSPRACAESHCVSVKPTDPGFQFHSPVDVAWPPAWHSPECAATLSAWQFLSDDEGNLLPPVGLYILHHALLI